LRKTSELFINKQSFKSCQLTVIEVEKYFDAVALDRDNGSEDAACNLIDI